MVSADGGMHKVAPEHNGTKMSRRNGSKVGMVSRLVRRPGPTPNSSISHPMKCPRPRRLPTTALGVPVDPDVK
jgi:hypothetical protein